MAGVIVNGVVTRHRVSMGKPKTAGNSDTPGASRSNLLICGLNLELLPPTVGIAVVADVTIRPVRVM